VITDIAWWEMVLRVVAAALGGVIGVDREERGKNAGMRTRMLLAACTAPTLLVRVGMRLVDVRAAPSRRGRPRMISDDRRSSGRPHR
jgi:uncharacterized membrane protein YhiD involved in acid resistance